MAAVQLWQKSPTRLMRRLTSGRICWNSSMAARHCARYWEQMISVRPARTPVIVISYCHLLIIAPLYLATTVPHYTILHSLHMAFKGQSKAKGMQRKACCMFTLHSKCIFSSSSYVCMYVCIHIAGMVPTVHTGGSPFLKLYFK